MLVFTYTSFFTDAVLSLLRNFVLIKPIVEKFQDLIGGGRRVNNHHSSEQWEGKKWHRVLTHHTLHHGLRVTEGVIMINPKKPKKPKTQWVWYLRSSGFKKNLEKLIVKTGDDILDQCVSSFRYAIYHRFNHLSELHNGDLAPRIGW